MRHHPIATVLIGALAVLTACGQPTDTGAGSGATDDGPGASAPGPGDTTVICGGATYAEPDLAAAPPVSSLPEGPAGAVDDLGDPVVPTDDDWRVVSLSEDRAAIVRELSEPVDHGDGDVRTHESRVFERIVGATNVEDGTWMLTAAGPCTPRLVGADDLGAADLTLATEPSADDTSLELLVLEQACASGRTAEDRIVVLDVEETSERIALRIGIRPPAGDQTCPSNPPTPVTIELSGPVDGREIVDASIVPPRALPVDERAGLDG